MVLRTNHLWIAAGIVALALVFVVQRGDRLRADRAQRESLVDSCERSSARTAIIAAWAFDAARTRASSGDTAAARRYNGYARSIIDAIPTTPAHKGDLELADVEEIKVPRTDILSYKLTDRAKDLQAQGCEALFKKP